MALPKKVCRLQEGITVPGMHYITSQWVRRVRTRLSSGVFRFGLLTGFNERAESAARDAVADDVDQLIAAINGSELSRPLARLVQVVHTL